MIEITTRDIGSNNIYYDAVENEFICPNCQVPNIYYTRSQILCDHCDELLPDIEDMRTTMIKRLGYFLYGDTYV